MQATRPRSIASRRKLHVTMYVHIHLHFMLPDDSQKCSRDRQRRRCRERGVDPLPLSLSLLQGDLQFFGARQCGIGCLLGMH